MKARITVATLILTLSIALAAGALFGVALAAPLMIEESVSIPTGEGPSALQVTLQAASFPVIADFEGGLPAGWFQYVDPLTTTLLIPSVVTITDTDSLALPGQVGNNDVLSVTANVPTWGGFGAALSPAQDWSDYDALAFWF